MGCGHVDRVQFRFTLLMSRYDYLKNACFDKNEKALYVTPETVPFIKNMKYFGTSLTVFLTFRRALAEDQVPPAGNDVADQLRHVSHHQR